MKPGFLVRLVATMLVLVVLIVGALEFWTRQPVAAPTPVLDLPAGVTTLVLVIHGSADEDDPLLREIVAALASRYRDLPGSAVRFVKWAPAADQRLRAAATAQAIGRQLGEALTTVPTLRELVLVAHSSGTFMPDAICTAWRAGSTGPVRVAMTLLDPFQIHGFVDWTWGARQHGRCADFTLAVINTDDPAPATNRPLRQAFNLDVTGHPGAAGFQPNGHYWPLRYYLENLLDRQPEIARWSWADHPRGAVRVVTQDASGDATGDEPGDGP